jgi:hypothetical protein
MQHHYLVVYDRRKGKILRHASYLDSSRALSARFDAEREFRGQSDIEVVVLSAESWESLTHTHARYFKAPYQLAEAALNRLGAAD